MAIDGIDGKVALITGAARGQGAAEASLFASHGASVVMTDIDEVAGQTLASELGPNVMFCLHDVTSEQQWKDVVDAALDRFGRLDVLVNNAGVLRVAPLLETTLAEYLEVIGINQVGTFLGMRAVAPSMIQGGGGSIVNISSLAAFRGGEGKMAYAASKWAVRGMTKVAAAELARYRIRVNSVHPGGVDTPMLDVFPGIDDVRNHGSGLPLGRLATPEEIARTVLWLSSDEASYTTGSEILIDGGVLAM